MKSKAHSKKCVDLGVSVGLIDEQDTEESGKPCSVLPSVPPVLFASYCLLYTHAPLPSPRHSLSSSYSVLSFKYIYPIDSGSVFLSNCLSYPTREEFGIQNSNA